MIALGLLVALGPALTLLLAIFATARFARHRSRMRDASDEFRTSDRPSRSPGRPG